MLDLWGRIRNIRTIILEKWITYGIIVIMVFIPVSYLLSFNTIYCWPTQLLAIRLMRAYFFVFAFLCIVNKNLKIHIVQSDIWIIIMSIIGGISVAFSIFPYQSFNGSFRGDGYLQMIAYFLMFFCVTCIKDEVNKKRIIVSLLILGISECIFGIFQAYGIIDYGEVPNVAVGCTTHFNFFASFVTIITCLFLGFYLFSKSKNIKIIALICSALSFTCLLCTTTRSAFLAVILVILFTLFAEVWVFIKSNDKIRFKSYVKKIIFITFIFTVLFVGISSSLEFLQTKISSINNEMLSSTSKDELGSGRIYLWKRALMSLPEYWATGCGMDNLGIANNNPNFPPFNYKYPINKAHNEYLEILITQGVFQVTAYICFLLSIFIKLFKKWLNSKNGNSMSSIYFALTLAFCGYVSQAFFNISRINVVPYFWIICGLLCIRDENFEIKKLFKKKITEGDHAK